MGTLVDIVTVTHNSGSVFKDWVDRTVVPCGDLTDVFIVDSGSTQAYKTLTAESLSQCRARRWHFIALEKNLGYGRCSNIGARESNAPWLAFINPDVEVGHDDIVALVRKAELHGEQLVGPTLLSDRGNVVRSRIVKEMEFSSRFPLSGACLLVRQDLFLALGGFDTRFFMFAEEVDLEARAIREFGVTPRVSATVFAVTRGGGSSEGVSLRWGQVERRAAHIVYSLKNRSLPFVMADFVIQTSWVVLTSRGRGLGTDMRQFWNSIRARKLRPEEYEEVLRQIKAGEIEWKSP